MDASSKPTLTQYYMCGCVCACVCEVESRVTVWWGADEVTAHVSCLRHQLHDVFSASGAAADSLLLTPQKKAKKKSKVKHSLNPRFVQDQQQILYGETHSEHIRGSKFDFPVFLLFIYFFFFWSLRFTQWYIFAWFHDIGKANEQFFFLSFFLPFPHGALTTCSSSSSHHPLELQM